MKNPIFRHPDRQQGFVSIFTVMFFVLLITIITVGFLRIMSQEQRQSVDNDLTASALASAEAGVEDAKRAILRYSSGGDRGIYGPALRSGNCDAIFGNSTIRNDLGLRLDAQGQGQVSNQANLLQAYTCLTVNLDTEDYQNKLEAYTSDYIPLKSDTNFNNFNVSWHLTSDEGDRQPRAYAAGPLLPQATGAFSWADNGYPAYLRVQLIGYPKGNFNLDSLEPLSRAAFLVPTRSATGADENNPINLEASDSRDPAQNRVKSSPMAVRCKGNPPQPVNAVYACTVRLNMTGPLNSATTNFFLRVTPIYGPTNIRVSMANNASPVRFVEVQPLIDSTGRAGDVYRRVQTRVRLDSTVQLPEYALEAGEDICKDFIVTANPSDYRTYNNCD